MSPMLFATAAGIGGIILLTWLKIDAIPRTTVGRFWGYIGVAIALLVSLAGNVESAKLHTPSIDPSDVEYAFAGLPPLVAFISIEIVNHNPWVNISWGKWVTRVLLFVVAPGSALVSFVHLTLVGLHSLQVPIPGELQTSLNVATAILTALLIDGLILGGTAALLLPKQPQEPPQPEPAQEEQPQEPVRPEPIQEKPVRPEPPQEKQPEPVRKPRVKAMLAVQEKKRYPPREHPAWPEYVESRQAGVDIRPEEWVSVVKEKIGKDMTPAAAQTMLSRWGKEYEKV